MTAVLIENGDGPARTDASAPFQAVGAPLELLHLERWYQKAFGQYPYGQEQNFSVKGRSGHSDATRVTA